MPEREQRLFQFTDWLKESRKLKNDAALVDTLGISSAAWARLKGNKSNLGIDLLTTIVFNHPQLNSDWMLTGRGSMLDGKRVLVATAQGITEYVPEPYHPILPEDDAGVHDPLRGAAQYTANLEVGKEVFISGKRPEQPAPVKSEGEDYRSKYFEVLEKYNQCLERLHERP